MNDAVNAFAARIAVTTAPTKERDSLGLRAYPPATSAGTLEDCPTFFFRGSSRHFFSSSVTANNGTYEPFSNSVNNQRIVGHNPDAHSSSSFFSTLKIPVRINKPSSPLKLHGANARSLFTLENFYFLHKLLKDQNPDILFLVETWHQSTTLKPLLDKRYKAIFSQDSDERGGGVAILFRADLLVIPLFPELHLRNFLLARLSSTSSTPALLMCAYMPPDHARKTEMLAHIARVADFLTSRYQTFSLVGFGDLNVDLLYDSFSPQAKRWVRLSRDYNLVLHYLDDRNSFTRKQGNRRSYLDYFMTHGVCIEGLSLGPNFGSSDHRIVSCYAISFTPVKRSQRQFLSKERARRRLLELINGWPIEPSILDLAPQEFFRELSSRLKMHATIFEPKPKNYFKVRLAVETELTKVKPDWKRVRKALWSCNKLEFWALLERARSLRQDQELKEFHRIIGDILKVRKASLSVREIEDPLAQGQVISDPNKLREILSTKYCELFTSHGQVTCFEVGYIEPTSWAEVAEAAELVSTNKGLGTDCIPDLILSIRNPALRLKLIAFVNLIFLAKSIPLPFCCARLHLISKLGLGVPSVDDIRPIMVTSPLLKLIEAIALIELKEKVEPHISKPQVGFLTDQSTQVHILRLLGKVQDVRSSPRFAAGKWFIFFVDFKSAFDRVNHRILFDKLRLLGLSERTLNILALLYNSYHYSILGDFPRKVNSGVAQGSLVSPLLYDFYVNDLVEELRLQMGAENTFAYADDIALLCLGYSDIRRALVTIETWGRKNGALLNKKKCGILPICKRETSWPRRELEGIPFVRVYKYLGVPLDPALTLKHLVILMKAKISKFSRRIGLMLHSITGTKAKLEIWQTYARCHFDYFAPAIFICDQTKKFSQFYTKSLKTALDLPLCMPNDRIMMAAGVPTLEQIAGHHTLKCTKAIRERFNQMPSSLSDLLTELSGSSNAYDLLKTRGSILPLSQGHFEIDLLSFREAFDKNTLGLFCGTFLSIRFTEGLVGNLRVCPVCKVPALQVHFLNECPALKMPREILSRSIPKDLWIQYLSGGDFQAFFLNLRTLEVRSLLEESLIMDLLSNLARATSSVATLIVKGSLALFSEQMSD